MRTTLVLLILLDFGQSIAQQVPHDSVILKTIFGRVDKNKTSFTRVMGDEPSDQLKVTFKIVYKNTLNLDGKKYLFVATEATSRYGFGHRMGYAATYFLNTSKHHWLVSDSIISEGEVVLGDDSNHNIVTIGKNRKALTSTFQSSGNNHFEKTMSVDLLEIGRITPLVTIELEYDNTMWKMREDSSACEATKFSNVFEIVSGAGAWYDIKSHRTEYAFKAGCRETVISSESDLVYKYRNGKYISFKP